MSKDEYDEAVAEARVLSSLDSKWVISYHDCFVEEDKLNILMQYAEGGTLHERIRRAKSGFPESTVWWYFIQVQSYQTSVAFLPVKFLL